MKGKTTLKQEHIQTLIAFAKCDMNIQATASCLQIVRRTVDYRLDSVHKRTGIDPKTFWGLVKLLKICKKEINQNE